MDELIVTLACYLVGPETVRWQLQASGTNKTATAIPPTTTTTSRTNNTNNNSPLKDNVPRHQRQEQQRQAKHQDDSMKDDNNIFDDSNFSLYWRSPIGKNQRRNVKQKSKQQHPKQQQYDSEILFVDIRFEFGKSLSLGDETATRTSSTNGDDCLFGVQMKVGMMIQQQQQQTEETYHKNSNNYKYILSDVITMNDIKNHFTSATLLSVIDWDCTPVHVLSKIISNAFLQYDKYQLNYCRTMIGPNNTASTAITIQNENDNNLSSHSNYSLSLFYADIQQYASFHLGINNDGSSFNADTTTTSESTTATTTDANTAERQNRRGACQNNRSKMRNTCSVSNVDPIILEMILLSRNNNNNETESKPIISDDAGVLAVVKAYKQWKGEWNRYNRSNKKVTTTKPASTTTHINSITGASDTAAMDHSCNQHEVKIRGSAATENCITNNSNDNRATMDNDDIVDVDADSIIDGTAKDLSNQQNQQHLEEETIQSTSLMMQEQPEQHATRQQKQLRQRLHGYSKISIPTNKRRKLQYNG